MHVDDTKHFYAISWIYLNTKTKTEIYIYQIKYRYVIFEQDKICMVYDYDVSRSS